MWIDRRWLIPAIAFSALLNLFLLGMVGSHLFAQHAPVVERALVPASRVEALPPAERARYVAAMAAHEAQILPARQAHQAARLALEATLTAPTFDAEKVATAFAALRRARETLQERTHAALADALSQLPASSRAALVKP